MILAKGVLSARTQIDQGPKSHNESCAAPSEVCFLSCETSVFAGLHGTVRGNGNVDCCRGVNSREATTETALYCRARTVSRAKILFTERTISVLRISFAFSMFISHKVPSLPSSRPSVGQIAPHRLSVSIAPAELARRSGTAKALPKRTRKSESLRRADRLAILGARRLVSSACELPSRSVQFLLDSNSTHPI